jgi:hypothetical protein
MREVTVLDIWPALPIAIGAGGIDHEIVENVISAFQYEGRVSQISIHSRLNNMLETIVEAMKHPFPTLTRLSIDSADQTAMVLPDSLLGGCAPRLRSLRLQNVAFSALPKLLLSATGLVDLSLSHIDLSQWMSPSAMFDCLSLLTGLEQFCLEFKSRYYFGRENQDLHSTLAVLPHLTTLHFQGPTEYFDGLFPTIDTPLLKRVDIQFFDPPTFDMMRITSLLGLTETFEMPDRAYLLIAHELVDVILSPRKGTKDDKLLQLSMTWKLKDWYLTRVYYPSSSPSPHYPIESSRQRIRAITMNRGRTHWLDLLRFFPATENLYLYTRIGSCIVFALQELAPEEVTKVLPALQNLFIEHLWLSGHVEEAIGKFVAARRRFGHPVAVHRWERRRVQ